jgi:hypothetical protein
LAGSMTDWPTAHKPYIPSILISNAPAVQQKSGYFSLQLLGGSFASTSVKPQLRNDAFGKCKTKEKVERTIARSTYGACKLCKIPRLFGRPPDRQTIAAGDLATVAQQPPAD